MTRERIAEFERFPNDDRKYVVQVEPMEEKTPMGCTVYAFGAIPVRFESEWNPDNEDTNSYHSDAELDAICRWWLRKRPALLSLSVTPPGMVMVPVDTAKRAKDAIVSLANDYRVAAPKWRKKGMPETAAICEKDAKALDEHEAILSAAISGVHANTAETEITAPPPYGKQVRIAVRHGGTMAIPEIAPESPHMVSIEKAAEAVRTVLTEYCQFAGRILDTTVALHLTEMVKARLSPPKEGGSKDA